MASEDLLELAAEAQKMIPRAIDVFEQAVFIGSVVDDLAAEVRELRRDKARLDWLCEQTGEGLLLHSTRGGCEVEWSGYGLGTLGGTRTLRAAIDAAMGGEAQTHD